ncbi:LON peptidase substrate-binding domain-containing protein [Pseudomonas fluorescens]|uniref:LON peptidase substrate-binding domain-containing protein n=1 Tax=Pseudomonas fluorescens TaxID=294 RepID=A0AAE2PXC1_PSEFL|nr:MULTISPECIES: LON peptidase substrate-binding domain-containing protein [Pseudomonas fluorescens group]MBA1428241.1 ATP-dependent protease [Pseudomonas orientalis]MBD8148559.1 LON peptidase substrate-binding domain-containing protein [Pseudomonas fluorescens]MBD8179163.1 LON peptidase substrate-binding domain-containing protein [Pseudomonas fluorescens]MBD8270167.1 LON peptidase substrate-binding domain-containing protein [Pseudomonas fluorescens]MBD8744553.1 LON peptidase substrate-binding
MSLALFPLNTVLFPGCTLDLQLFEARYLDMISRCMKKGESFGVVCILDGKEVGLAPDGYALIGCEALIRDFTQQDNGLLGIRVEGGRRFRVHDAKVQKDQLLVADVQWLEELPDQPLEEEDADLLALLQALAEHPMVASLDMDAHAEGQQALSNQLAYLLPFTEADKVDLLQLDDPQMRLDAIQMLLDELQGELFT